MWQIMQKGDKNLPQVTMDELLKQEEDNFEQISDIFKDQVEAWAKTAELIKGYNHEQNCYLI